MERKLKGRKKVKEYEIFSYLVMGEKLRKKSILRCLFFPQLKLPYLIFHSNIKI